MPINIPSAVSIRQPTNVMNSGTKSNFDIFQISTKIMKFEFLNQTQIRISTGLDELK